MPIGILLYGRMPTKEIMAFNSANMNLGTPILLSGDQPILLSRVGMEHGDTANYQECLLQKLIDKQPGILPVCDFFPGITSLFSLGREIPVDIGGAKGYIDNLLVTDDGRLVLVETKLWRNPEALREVLAQTLQYAMAVSQLSSLEFETQLRQSDHKARHLGADETVAQYLGNLAASESLPGLDDEFEDRFDQLRRAGEILLLIVADGMRSSAERLVHWMNATVGYAPYKLGLIELRLYDLPDFGRIVVPKTLLRIREAFRHVVSINLQAAARDQVAVSVTGTDGQTTTGKPWAPDVLTEEAMTDLIRAKNSAEICEIAEQLRARLRSSELRTRYCPSEIIYGVEVDGDFIWFVHVCAKYVYFVIPSRAVRVLGDERFVHFKRKINEVADFYRLPEAADPSTAYSRLIQYAILKGKVDDFMKAITEIAGTIRDAMREALSHANGGLP
ncbi:MAG TPA: hypothetical protein VLI55_15195 [Bryobacteraceae bacterium]|nr:hypothetical protein [Bryobacteraceae bacterium]